MTNASGMRLDQIAREIPGEVEIFGDASVFVAGVRHDSRAIEQGDLFVAKKGQAADGARFVAEARARGAVAVLAARGAIDPKAAALPVLLVADVADGLAYSAAAVYGHPAFSLEIVGVTGTNGKTTTTHLVRAAVDGGLGAPLCGTIGTVGHEYDGGFVPAAHTTPEADELARILAAMRARGATHVAMEVSSIALVLGRVRAVRFRVAALTNLTQDHLDFHGSMDAYGDAKALLFTACDPGAAVINIDDPFGRKIADGMHAPIVRVSAKLGMSESEADIAPRTVSIGEDGIQARLHTPVGDIWIRSRLLGAHNLENIVVALGIAHALELDLAGAAAGIEAEPGAPGRLERCDIEGDDIIVLVDYAHTPDALTRALQSVRSATTGKLWCVFGCGGDRDREKRGPMGEAAARGADTVIITSDNPRTEDPAAIALSIEQAVKNGGAKNYRVEVDRKAAIEAAIDGAAAGDLVLIAGKGHEDYQVIGTERRPFDDRVEARNALKIRRKRVLS